MSREVRRVPADWQHPTDGHYPNGEVRYVSLFDGRGFADNATDWDADAAKWASGEFPSYANEADRKLNYAEWAGERPDPKDYMPCWSDTEATHFMMYETCSEGSPISPAFATQEELARWLTDNNASAFGDRTASYDAWLRIAYGGYAPSAVITNGVITSGVEAFKDTSTTTSE